LLYHAGNFFSGTWLRKISEKRFGRKNPVSRRKVEKFWLKNESNVSCGLQVARLKLVSCRLLLRDIKLAKFK